MELNHTILNQPSSQDNSQAANIKSIKHCQLCAQSQKQLLRCARCKKVFYCGAQCQKKHWPTHKINCSRAKQNSGNPQGSSSNCIRTQQKINISTDQNIRIQNSKTQNLQPENPFHGLNQFGKLTHIGSGNFSQIFKATSKKDNLVYAIKQVQKAKVQRVRKQADLFMEKHCLSKLKDCPYAIKLYRTFQDQLNLFIQMEFPEGGQLWQQCRTFGLFSQEQFRYYAAHLVKAIKIIHDDYRIVHRDLKPQNILLDKQNNLKLIDFGTAKDLDRPDIKGSGNGLKGKKPFQHYVGTPNYMAPQCIHNKASQKKSDIYSLSGIFYFMKVGAPPFTGGSQFIVFKKSLQTKIFLCQQLFSPQLQDLILNMNKKSIQQRYTIDQVLQHQFFKSIDFNNLPVYKDIQSKISPLCLYLKDQSKQIFQKYHKIAIQQQSLNKRKKIYQQQIQPFIQQFKNKIPQQIQLTKDDLKWLDSRIDMMKIQCKVMMNYYDDNSSGFSELYNKDFNSAQRLINAVKNKQNKDKNNSRNQQNKNCQSNECQDDQPDNQEKQTQKDMKKKQNTQQPQQTQI